jgi:hypothetical protein
MEDVLAVYEKDASDTHPLVCVDEKPIQLLADVRPPSGIRPGEVKKLIVTIRGWEWPTYFVLLNRKRGFT